MVVDADPARQSGADGGGAHVSLDAAAARTPRRLVRTCAAAAGHVQVGLLLGTSHATRGHDLSGQSCRSRIHACLPQYVELLDSSRRQVDPSLLVGRVIEWPRHPRVVADERAATTAA